VKNVCIYGAGKAGFSLLRALRSTHIFNVCFFIDDFKNSVDLFGLPVINSKDLNAFVKEFNICEIFVSIPSASSSLKRDLLDRLTLLGVSVSVIDESVIKRDGIATNFDLRDVNIYDLTGRDPVISDLDSVKAKIANQVILITGAGGSIGSELVRQTLSLFPDKVIAIDNSEYNLYSLQESLIKIGFDKAAHYHLRDVKDSDSIEELFIKYKPSIVFHAAAYKHVPIVEDNIIDGVSNNIIGTSTVLNLCIKYGSTNFVLISTDKAVRPTNYMGASKRICELLIQYHSKFKDHDISCTSVRFGNVVGSSGSVIPKFLDQIKRGGPVTVTHPEIIRYFMTIPEACHLVIQTLSLSGNSDIFLLDMGEPIKILDIAKKLIELSGYAVGKEGIEISFTGLRSGEKLYEELLISGKPLKTLNPSIYRGGDEFNSMMDFSSAFDGLIKALVCRNLVDVKRYVEHLVPDFSNSAIDNSFLGNS
jgi:FlaA1/EpsC-like NDP-sugar epimerase